MDDAFYGSIYKLVTGQGKTYQDGWSKRPQSVIYMVNNELAIWTATGARSVIRHDKYHTFKAGCNTLKVNIWNVNKRHEHEILLRCIALNSYFIKNNCSRCTTTRCKHHSFRYVRGQVRLAVLKCAPVFQ